MPPLDILYLTLALCSAILTLFVSMTLIYLMFILRDIVKVTEDVKRMVDKINQTVAKPLLLTKNIIEFVTPFIQGAEERLSRRKK